MLQNFNRKEIGYWKWESGKEEGNDREKEVYLKLLDEFSCSKFWLSIGSLFKLLTLLFFFYYYFYYRITVSKLPINLLQKQDWFWNISYCFAFWTSPSAILRKLMICYTFLLNSIKITILKSGYVCSHYFFIFLFISC